MSSSYLYGFTGDPDDAIEQLWEGGNSSGIGMILYATGRADWQGADQHSYNMGTTEEWYADACSEDSRMAYHDRVMAQLVGHGLVIMDDAARELPAIIRAWLEAHADLHESWHSNHWPELAAVFEEHAGGRFAGFGIWLTSTIDDPFGKHVEAGYDRFFEWREAHWAMGPLDDYPQLDLAMLRVLASHTAPTRSVPPPIRTEFLKGDGEEVVLRRLMERLNDKDISPQWFAEAFGIVCSLEGVRTVQSQPKAVQFLFLKYAVDPGALEPRPSDWWYNLATDAAMCAHGFHDLDSAIAAVTPRPDAR